MHKPERSLACLPTALLGWKGGDTGKGQIEFRLVQVERGRGGGCGFVDVAFLGCLVVAFAPSERVQLGILIGN